MSTNPETKSRTSVARRVYHRRDFAVVEAHAARTPAVLEVHLQLLAEMPQHRLDRAVYDLPKPADRGHHHCFGEPLDLVEVAGASASLGDAVDDVDDLLAARAARD